MFIETLFVTWFIFVFTAYAVFYIIPGLSENLSKIFGIIK